jgi:uncharacterized phage protein (TIGR01671 family)
MIRMREIKFRAYVNNPIHGKGIFSVKSINFEPFVCEVAIEGEIVSFFDFDDITLLEYTGLKDRNGKDIYEGDILLVTSEIYTNFGKTPTGRFSKEYYEVVWKDDGWGHKVLKSDHTIEGTEIIGLKVTTKYAEVIGNRYAIPELLEGIEYESKME